MRRTWLWTGLLALVGGCELFSAHADVAATSAGARLESSQLADLMSKVKGIQPTKPGADFVIRYWTDYILFANAVADKMNFGDSAIVSEAMWTEITEMRGVAWHDTLLAHRSGTTDATIDSVYNLGQIRGLQHIMIRADSGSPDSVMAKARKRIDAIYAQVKAGANFGKLAEKESEDPGSQKQGGMLEVGPRGRFVSQFDAVGWALGPGQLSPVMKTRFGFHIVRRPPVSEVRDAFRAYLLHAVSAALDSIYLDSLSIKNQLTVVPDAGNLLKGAMKDPEGALKDQTPVATYTGGVVTMSTLVRWAGALPPQFTSQLRQGDDSTLRQFTRVIGQNVLLMHQADSAGITISPAQWTEVHDRFLTQVDTVKKLLGVTDQSFVDSAATGARGDLLAAHVLDYMNKLGTGAAKLRPVPFQLAPMLRLRYPHGTVRAGVDEAIKYMTDPARTGGDSAGHAGKAPHGQMLPPGGPPPVPQGAPTPGATPSTAPAPHP
jgi:hypothetical protein